MSALTVSANKDGDIRDRINTNRLLFVCNKTSMKIQEQTEHSCLQSEEAMV